jgi:hypothetical protein
MEALSSSETSVLTRATQRDITDGGILRRTYSFYGGYEVFAVVIMKKAA